MNGQWIGSYSGTNTGSLVADLDDLSTHYAGVVFGYDYNLAPRIFAHVEIPKAKTTFLLRVGLLDFCSRRNSKGKDYIFAAGRLVAPGPGVGSAADPRGPGSKVSRRSSGYSC